MTAVIDACAKVGDAVRAEKWMESMKLRGIEPNVDVYRAMMDVDAKACNAARALQWYKALQMLGGVPTRNSIAALVSSCAQAGDAVSARWWLSSMEASCLSPDAGIYGSVLDVCVKVNDIVQAKLVYRKMHCKGIHPTIVTYASLARALAHNGDWREVEALACQMKKDGQTMNDYFLYALLLAYATGKPRQPQRAEQAFREALNLDIQMNGHVFSALHRAVGRTRGQQLIEASKLKVDSGLRTHR